MIIRQEQQTTEFRNRQINLEVAINKQSILEEYIYKAIARTGKQHPNILTQIKAKIVKKIMK